MSAPSHSPKSTTFLLLKPVGQTPPITNTSDPAGDAFNSSLRKIASLPEFHSQLFGWRDTVVPSRLVPSAGTDVTKDGELIWDAKYVGWRKPGEPLQHAPELEPQGEALVWVISMALWHHDLDAFGLHTDDEDGGRLGLAADATIERWNNRLAWGLDSVF